MIGYEQMRTKGTIFYEMSYKCFRNGNSLFLILL